MMRIHRHATLIDSHANLACPAHFSTRSLYCHYCYYCSCYYFYSIYYGYDWHNAYYNDYEVSRISHVQPRKSEASAADGGQQELIINQARVRGVELDFRV